MRRANGWQLFASRKHENQNSRNAKHALHGNVLMHHMSQASVLTKNWMINVPIEKKPPQKK
jgi:hypothetical protein